MRLVPAILALAAFSGTGTSHAAGVELPQWKSAAEAAAYSLGGGLWPAGLLTGYPEKSATSRKKTLLAKGAKVEGKEMASKAKNGAESNQADAKGNQADDTATLLADQMELEKSVGGETPAEILSATGTTKNMAREDPGDDTLPPIEGKLRDSYFARAPFRFLIDPQHLLTEQKSNDLSRFLEFQSDEAKFHMYVMVLGETQQIPSDISLEKLHEAWFEENPTVLMVYYRERPDKTQLVYNRSVRSLLPRSVFDRIKENCLRQGASTQNAPDQVEKIAVEMSIQLYWLARLMDRELELRKKMTITPAEGGAGIVDTLAVESPAVVAALKENDSSTPVIIVEDADNGTESRFQIDWWYWLGAVGGGMLVVMVFAGVLAWRRHRDGLRGRPLLFPDCEVSHRLGGRFSGGSYVGISFDVSDEKLKG